MAAFRQMGYPIHSGPYNLNLFAIRRNVGGATGQSTQDDTPDDLVGVLYQDTSGAWRCETFAATTEAGLKWLRRKLSSAVFGRPRTPILLPGHYPGMYEAGSLPKGRHKTYRAFRQRVKALYAADLDTDDRLDLNYRCLPGGAIRVIDDALLFWGLLFTNLHRGSKWRTLVRILGYSAGCVVVAEAASLDRLLALVDLQDRYGWGTICSFSLFTRFAFTVDPAAPSRQAA